MSNTLDTFLEDLQIRPVTRHTVLSLFFDLPLTPPALCDFGVATAKHYQALREVLFGGPAEEAESVDEQKEYEALCQRVTELEQAFGNGPMLNALVKKYAPAYTPLVHFHTLWDEIFARTDEVISEE